MGSIIDNKEKTMLASLKNALAQTEKIDILTAFFYFSGFNALADDLKDKKIRILVGNTIDPDAIDLLCQNLIKNNTESLETYAVRGFNSLNNNQKKDKYINSFVNMFNKSSLSEEFDSEESRNIFKMFVEKMKNGTLEIKITKDLNHAKAYILKFKEEYSCNGDNKGIVFSGSSNFTFNGLLGQGEMNERIHSNEKYDEYENKFEELWSNSTSVDVSVKNGNKDFEEELKNKLWIYAKPSPYEIFIRVLYELFNSTDTTEIKNPFEITNGKYFNLKYQIDAVKSGIDCINKNNGVIIADVVGLGKSIISSAIAYNLDIKKTVIIAPPHLVDQWNDYQQDFGLRGVKVFSSGKIDSVYKTYSKDPDSILYIIDEAHRYRNEINYDYQMLHQLTRSNSGNKVILLTATPYNNKPQDLYALIKLFQTPSRSTINTVNNLGVKFHELIARYNKLEKEGKKNIKESTKNSLELLSSEIRLLIDPVVIRRSRIDLKEIKEYADDLKLQGIQFPNVIGPELINYDLGNIRDIYLDTLEKISNKFHCARYNPSLYLINPAEFNDKYGELFGEMDIQLFLRNIAQFIKRLLVMRFESSKAAFKVTLSNLIVSYENIIKWWEKGYVPIKKGGYLSDPDDDEISSILTEMENDDLSFDLEKIKKKTIPFPKNLFNERYISDVKEDLKLLKEINNLWFGKNQIGDDPKYNEVAKKIISLLKDNSNRKIVIFSTYSDTVKYVSNRLREDGFKVMLYTSTCSQKDRDTVKENFDASYEKRLQRDDSDIIVASDSLSEGFNLNRAGIIINYDIPYNPTKVVQRIGRINRVNKKMFDNIYIFNFFPTDIGEKNILVKGISTLKMFLINDIVGSDTKTLTQDETLQSYFKKQYSDAASEQNNKSWDVEYRNIYSEIKHNENLISKCLKIPERIKIVRNNQFENCAVSFVKKGANYLFATAVSNQDAKIVPVSKAINYFKAEIEEKSFCFDIKLDKKFELLCNEIKRTCSRVKMDKRKGNAIDNLKKLCLFVPSERNYFCDLLEVIQDYDDLSDGELKEISNKKINCENSQSIANEIKNNIPVHYINQIKIKAESIENNKETIMFMEDLRSDNN